MLTPHPADLERWHAKIRYAPAPPGVTGDCWLWTGSTDRKGYGKFRARGVPGFDGRVRRDKGRETAAVLAHRFGLWVYFGECCLRLHADHRCRRVACVNPWHLVPAEPTENTAMGNRLRSVPVDYGDPFDFLESTT